MQSLRRYKITIEYDGRGFSGWQKHKGPEGAACLSIEQQLETALFQLFGKEIILNVAGRTDAGVHAWGQVAHFDLKGKPNSLEPYKIMKALNFYLKLQEASCPKGEQRIAIVNIKEVGQDFHARFSAKKRHYEYLILNRQAPITIERGLYWQVFTKLNIAKMKEAAQAFIGKYNFNSFRASACQAKNPVKSIDNISIDSCPDLTEKISINISARSFLHNQVRIIIGTLVEIGKGKSLNIEEIIAKEDRRFAGPTAPPHGLYLKRIDY